jgi:hypothetical protein
MDQRLSLVTLGVADIDRARMFYEALGWSGESPDGEVVFFQVGCMIVALWGRDKLAVDSVVDDSGGWAASRLPTTLRRRMMSTSSSQKPPQPAQRSVEPAPRRSGADTPGSSSILMAIRGRLLIIQGGSLARTGPSGGRNDRSLCRARSTRCDSPCVRPGAAGSWPTSIDLATTPP